MTNYNLPILPKTHYWDVRPNNKRIIVKLMKYGMLKDKTIASAEVVFEEHVYEVATSLAKRI